MSRLRNTQLTASLRVAPVTSPHAHGVDVGHEGEGETTAVGEKGARGEERSDALSRARTPGACARTGRRGGAERAAAAREPADVGEAGTCDREDMTHLCRWKV